MPAKRITTEQFIERAKKVHGDKYDYSKTEYINSRTKVIITCPEHGDFEQLANNHTQGSRCPKCAKISRKELISDTTESFIEKAIAQHGNLYDYSKVNYIESRQKVIIICPIHGEFEQFPYDHIRGHKCPKCQSYHSFNQQKSKGEQLIEDWLNSKGIRYKDQFELITPKIARNSYCIIVDFFVKYNNKQYFIEYDGIQHFEYTPYFHKGGVVDFEKQQRRDKVLNDFCDLYKDKVTLIRFDYTMGDKFIITKLEEIL